MELQNATDSIPLASVEQLIEQLDALQPGKQQQKTALFRRLYPAIESALAREVPQKVVVAQLSEELPLSMGGFRALLEAERKRRAESGEPLCCDHCGGVLPVSSDASNPRDIPTLASLAAKSMDHRELVPEGNKHQ
ncbi:hypothetical protein ACI2UN_08765 [Ralstonia nicotianae]|uniref:hypothetical protein n=1 Tax=Ralstonia pseudosolanacearum TaxID=1310165 RepID=UPI00156DF96C